MDDDEMDIDQQLLSKFSSMGTTDRDVLITEFQNLLGKQLDPMGCAFFLEMTNWNLQAAIGAYYDYEMPSMNTPTMVFICDVTIGEGESVPPNTTFLKTWRLQNNGTEPWPNGCCLRYVQGDKMGATDFVLVSDLKPHQSGDVSVTMTSPNIPGIYQGQWRMHTSYGVPFGDIIWVIVTVEMGGLLGVTQQMSRFASVLGQREDLVASTIHSQPFGPVHQEMEAERQDNHSNNKQMSDVPMTTDDASNTNRSEIKQLFTASLLNNNLESNFQDTLCQMRRDSPIVSSGFGKSLDFWKPINDRECSEGIEENANHSTYSVGKLESIAEENNELYCDNIQRLNRTMPNLATNGISFRTDENDSRFNSPTKLDNLEKSFNSPNAPSPIKPQSSENILRRDGEAIFDCNLRQL